MNRCRSCNAPIRWERTEQGKSIPLDVEPRDDGNVHIYDRVAYVLDVHGAAIAEHRANGDRLYVSHFATCPDAAEHRTKPSHEPRGTDA